MGEKLHVNVKASSCGIWPLNEEDIIIYVLRNKAWMMVALFYKVSGTTFELQLQDTNLFIGIEQLEPRV